MANLEAARVALSEMAVLLGHHAMTKQFAIGDPVADAIIEDNEQDLIDLIEAARTGDIDNATFEDELTALMLALLLQSFLAGAGVADESDLAPGAVVMLDDLRTETTTSAMALAAEIDAGLFAEARDADDRITRTDEAGRDKARARIQLWIVALAGAFSAGRIQGDGSADSDAQMMQWVLGNTIEHCVDCLRLHGQVHDRQAWIASGFQPQGRNLVCGGWNCDCRLDDVDAAQSGSF